MSSGLFKMLPTNNSFSNCVCAHKQNLPLNNLRGLIFHKNPPKLTHLFLSL